MREERVSPFRFLFFFVCIILIFFFNLERDTNILFGNCAQTFARVKWKRDWQKSSTILTKTDKYNEVGQKNNKKKINNTVLICF